MSIQLRALGGGKEGGRLLLYFGPPILYGRPRGGQRQQVEREREREDRGRTDRRDHGRLMSANGTAPPLAEAASKKGCPTCAAERKDEIFNI